MNMNAQPSTRCPSLDGEWVRVAHSDEVNPEKPFGVRIGGMEVVVLRMNAELRAFTGICPHRGGLLAGGDLQDGHLVCPNHGWRFDGRSGQRLDGPQCLAAFDVQQLEDGFVYVRVRPESPSAQAVPPDDLGEVRSLADLPGPRGLPFIGVAAELRPSSFHRSLESWAREFGPIYQYNLAGTRILVCSDPAFSEIVLRERPHAWRRASKIEQVMRGMEILGVFAAEGDEWRSQRSLVMDALAPRNLRQFYPRLTEVARRLLRRWRGLADRDEEVDLQNEAMRFTVDVTTWLSLGQDVDTITGGGGDLQKHLGVVLPILNARLLALVPLWQWVPTLEKLRLRRALAGLRAWLDPLVAETRRTHALEPNRSPSHLLEAMAVARQPNGELYSDQALFANAINMLVAGEDTTANTITWAVHEVARHPEIASRLAQEADEVLETHELAEDASLLERTLYTRAVAHETTRLRPVAPIIFLESTCDQVTAGLSIPRGTQLLVLSRPAATDPVNFDDPEQFDPGRWLDAGAAARLQRNATHIPFGSGPRMCPARSLALMEIQLVLSMLYRNFVVVPASHHEAVTESFAFTMEPRGVRIRLRHRRH